MAVRINLNSKGEAEVGSVEDGEEFTTIAHTEYDGLYRCYEPEREDFEFVSLSQEYVASIEYDESERLTHDIVVYGDRSAWDDTPSSFYSQ